MKCLSLFIFILLTKESICRNPDIRCPDCSNIRCPELENEDCPEGTILTENIMLGCCPACLRYLGFDDYCPGVGYEVDENFNTKIFLTWINFKKEAVGDNTDNLTFYYPDEFIEATRELPCTEANIADGYSFERKHFLMPERYFDAEWKTSPRNDGVQVPVINSTRCAPNLECYADDPWSSNNVEDYTPRCSRPFTNELEENNEVLCALQQCDFRKYEDVKDCMFRYWEPNCNPYLGIFDTVQRKSTDSYYWCSNPNGERIFGEEKSTRYQPDINCKCSRKYWDLSQKKDLGQDEDNKQTIDLRNDISLHCEENGNYEPLQCDRKMCWCVNPQTGKVASKVLPENLIRFLPCFDRMSISNNDRFGGKYYRKCESRKLAIERTGQFLQERGSTWSNLETEDDCEPTGGFSKTYCGKTECECVTKGGALVDGYRFESNTDYPESTCNCARDRVYALTYDDCNPYGNYNTLKNHKSGDEGDLEYCVDPSDNFRMSGQVRKKSDASGKLCCLDSEYYWGEDDYWGITPEVSRPRYACRAQVQIDTDVSSCINCKDQVQDCQLANANR